ncbi:hypothetical protein [Halodesulfurarchaeum sp.]|uniref:hypothetical protein n=1 Tax=Halodesulfurarchaeum sp. TaxID=1980530 RepID=UPI001BBBD9A5|nr:hypothetical protein [Halodesulfurarchaeum sp.]
MTVETPAVSKRQYRWLDIGTKLGGVALFAAGLEAGIISAPGLLLVFTGALLGVSTVFITEETS